MTTLPNVVLITIDSLRADYCGYVTGDFDATPTITRLANEGIAFERAIAPGPSTPESMPAIFTGKYPSLRAQGQALELPRYHASVRQHMATRQTIAERLQAIGYDTAAFTPNPFTSRHFGFDHGFDHFEDFMGASRETSELYTRLFRGFLKGDTTSSMMRILVNMWQREEVFKPWASYIDEVYDWIHEADPPYFVWLFLMDAHNPYLPSAAYRSQSRLAQFHANYRFWRESHETPFSPNVHERLVTAYRDAVQYADAGVKSVVSELENDNPLVVVHGDHGEAFGEHGTYGHEPYLYPENVHVPFVIHGAGQKRIGNPCSLRALPEVLCRGLNGSSLDIANEFTVTQTHQGAQRAVYTRNGQFIAPNGIPFQASSREGVPVEIGRVLEGFEESLSENRRLRQAAVEVASG